MRKNNREKILATARQLLPKYGYNGISIRAIAAHANLTTGAIYFHFKNKREIYKNICLNALDILIEKFKTEIENRKTQPQKLISTFDSYINFFYENRDYYNILMEYKAAYKNNENEDMAEIAEKMCTMTNLMQDVVRQGIEQHKFRSIDPKLLSLLLGAIAEGVLQFKKLGIFDYMKVEDREFRQFMADIIGIGILTNK